MVRYPTRRQGEDETALQGALRQRSGLQEEGTGACEEKVSQEKGMIAFLIFVGCATGAAILIGFFRVALGWFQKTKAQRTFLKEDDGAKSALKKRLELLNYNSSRKETFFVLAFAPLLFFPEVTQNQIARNGRWNHDLVLFELSVDIFIRIDAHLLTNYPASREKYFRWMSEELSNLFSPSLGITKEAFSDVMNDRMNFYSKFVRSGDSLRFHETLVYTIQETLSAGIPRPGVYERPPFFGDVIQHSKIRTAVHDWEIKNIQRIIESVDDDVS